MQTLGDNPLSRSTDPETSHDAEYWYKKTKRSRHVRKLLNYFAKYPLDRSTAREAGDAIGLDGAWKRVSEMVSAGLLDVTDSRACGITGNRARTFRISYLGLATWHVVMNRETEGGAE